MHKICLLILAGTCWSGAALAASIPDCAGPVEIAHAQVVRVEKNGAMVLKDGRAALLEGIRLASADGSALSDQSLDGLRALAMAAPLTLTTRRPKEDRYGRVRVQAFGVGQEWLQIEMLRRGLARVDISPDRSECAPELYEAEGAARAAGRGLWALAAYAIRKPGDLNADIGNFEIVEGRVVNTGNADGRVFLDFNADYRQGFSATIAPDDRKTFRQAGFDPLGLEGKRVRLRGMVEDFGGRPEIALSNPAQIEVLE